MRQPAPLHDPGDDPEKRPEAASSCTEIGIEEDEQSVGWIDIFFLATFVACVCIGVGLLTKLLI
jgi:hypothetical protein